MEKMDIIRCDYEMEIWGEDADVGIRISKYIDMDSFGLTLLFIKDYFRDVTPESVEYDQSRVERDEVYTIYIGIFNARETTKRLRAFCDMYDAISKTED